MHDTQETYASIILLDAINIFEFFGIKRFILFLINKQLNTYWNVNNMLKLHITIYRVLSIIAHPMNYTREIFCYKYFHACNKHESERWKFMMIYRNMAKSIKKFPSRRFRWFTCFLDSLPSTEWPLNKTCAERSATTGNSIIYCPINRSERIFAMIIVTLFRRTYK